MLQFALLEHQLLSKMCLLGSLGDVAWALDTSGAEGRRWEIQATTQFSYKREQYLTRLKASKPDSSLLCCCLLRRKMAAESQSIRIHLKGLIKTSEALHPKAPTRSTDRHEDLLIIPSHQAVSEIWNELRSTVAPRRKHSGANATFNRPWFR
jgi:hypothetical protein